MATNSDDFMEKKIKKTSKGRKSSYSSEEKTVIATIIIALIIMSVLVAQLILTPSNPELCSAIYYLDSNKQTENLPSTVILGENNTFSLWVGVENQNDETIHYQVEMKIDDGTGVLNQSLVEHVRTFNKTLEDESVWEFEVEDITLDQLGTNRIIFELSARNTTATTNEYEYTGNWVNLSVEVVETS